MAMRRNQPNVHAKDLPDSGVTNSASFRPGEKRPITGATTCGSIVTAMASARKPATRLSPASRRKRKSLCCGIVADCSRRIPRCLSPFLWENMAEVQENKRHHEFPANHHLFLVYRRCSICCGHHFAARGGNAARPGSEKAADADD